MVNKPAKQRIDIGDVTHSAETHRPASCILIKVEGYGGLSAVYRALGKSQKSTESSVTKEYGDLPAAYDASEGSQGNATIEKEVSVATGYDDGEVSVVMKVYHRGASQEAREDADQKIEAMKLAFVNALAPETQTAGQSATKGPVAPRR